MREWGTRAGGPLLRKLGLYSPSYTGWPDKFSMEYWAIFQSSKKLGEVTFQRAKRAKVTYFVLRQWAAFVYV